MDIRFTDEKIEFLPYVIGIIFYRISKGNYITFDYQIQYKELAGTKEYTATEKLLKNMEDFPEIERSILHYNYCFRIFFSQAVQKESDFTQLSSVLKMY